MNKRNPYHLTAADVRRMVADYGFSHAEDMVNTCKGQTDIPEAVAELQRIFDADIAEFGSDIPDSAA